MPCSRCCARCCSCRRACSGIATTIEAAPDAPASVLYRHRGLRMPRAAATAGEKIELVLVARENHVKERQDALIDRVVARRPFGLAAKAGFVDALSGIE